MTPELHRYICERTWEIGTKAQAKSLRKYLDEKYGIGNWKHNGVYRNPKRGYGDYLWFQDRDMFNDVFQRWLKGEDV